MLKRILDLWNEYHPPHKHLIDDQEDDHPPSQRETLATQEMERQQRKLTESVQQRKDHPRGELPTLTEI